MSEDSSIDRRIQDRMLRERRITRAQVEERAGQLPDLADRVRTPSDDEIQAFADVLPREQEVRAERIERALERAVAPPPPAPTPVTEFDADDL
jgi:hypothetical protein